MKLRAIYLLGAATLLLGASAPADLALAQSAMGTLTTASPAGGAPEVSIPMGRAPEAKVSPMVEGATAPGRVPCPHPYTQTLRSSGMPQGGPDFPAAWAGHFASGLNDMRPNRIFAYTFHTKFPSPEKACCEITSAVLTIVAKCHGDIPSNNSWNIAHNGLECRERAAALAGRTNA